VHDETSSARQIADINESKVLDKLAFISIPSRSGLLS